MDVRADVGDDVVAAAGRVTDDLELREALAQAVELLGELGVRELAVFDRRERRLEPIGAV